MSGFATILVASMVAGCSASHVMDDSSDAAGTDESVPGLDGGYDMSDFGAGSDVPDAPFFDASDAGCVGFPVEPPGTACPGQFALRGAAIGGLDFSLDLLGPIDGMYADAHTWLAPRVDSAMRRVSLDVTTEDSRPLDGFPLVVGGHAFSAGHPEAASNAAGLLAVSVSGAVDTPMGLQSSYLLALYDSLGHLTTPMVPLGAGFAARQVEFGCNEVLVLGNMLSGASGSAIGGMSIGFDGSVRARIGPVGIVDADGSMGYWRGDHWTIMVVPQVDPSAAPYLVDLRLDGSLHGQRTLALPAFNVGGIIAIIAPHSGSWSVLIRDVATRVLSYARFDPDSGRIVGPPRVVYRPVGDIAPYFGMAREAGDIDGYVFLETRDTTDVRTVLLRVSADGTVVQTTDLQRGVLNPQPHWFRWLGDRYSVPLDTGTDVLLCVP